MPLKNTAVVDQANIGGPVPEIRLSNLAWVALAIFIMTGAIRSDNLWYLNFVHVMAGLLWTGIDLFMGFVVGPILRRLDREVRKAFIMRLMPRMLFLMPTLAILTTTAGWFLAQRLGYLDMPFPAQWWVVAALIIVTILTIQGMGILLPINVRVLLQLRKPNPDLQRISRWMRIYVWVIASQATMQVAIIVVMARFATGM
ncbi:hypothetical protein ACFL17_01000 [Pseudomonadota bacterium]